jgi:hypothetical protein
MVRVLPTCCKYGDHVSISHPPYNLFSFLTSPGSERVELIHDDCPSPMLPLLQLARNDDVQTRHTLSVTCLITSHSFTCSTLTPRSTFSSRQKPTFKGLKRLVRQNMRKRSSHHHPRKYDWVSKLMSGVWLQPSLASTPSQCREAAQHHPIVTGAWSRQPFS